MFSSLETAEIIQAKVGIQRATELAFSKTDAYEHGTALRQWIQSQCSITGGISASVFHQERPKDIDLYYSGPVVHYDVFSTAVNNLFIKPSSLFHQFVQDVNPKYMLSSDEDGAAGKMITANAVTLWNGLQIIRLAPIQESRKKFDFVHCLPVYDWKNYYISRQQFDSIKTKKLVANNFNNVKFHRVDKFVQRGWDRNGIIT